MSRGSTGVCRADLQAHLASLHHQRLLLDPVVLAGELLAGANVEDLAT